MNNLSKTSVSTQGLARSLRDCKNVIDENFVPGSYKVETDIRSLSEGTYVCRMIGDDINSNMKFMIGNTR